MAAAPARVLPADVQGGPLARLLISHPDAASAVFSHLTYLDATPLRAACRGLKVAVAEHLWVVPVPPPRSMTLRSMLGAHCMVRTAAGLHRWRACFPAARVLTVSNCGGTVANEPADADLAPLAACHLTGVHLEHTRKITAAGLAALATPALGALSVESMPQLTGAGVAAATARARRLRVLSLVRIGAVADADLAGWGGLHWLELRLTTGCGGFTGAGLAALAQLRELTLWLPKHVNWPGGAFRHLTHLHALVLERNWTVAGSSGFFDGAPASLRSVRIEGLAVKWRTDEAPDGGAALLRPLAHVSDVTLHEVTGVGDAGVSALTSATRLSLKAVDDVVGDCLTPLAGSLRELSVRGWGAFPRRGRFTGRGLASLASLASLAVIDCDAFDARVLPSMAASCLALARVDVTYRELPCYDERSQGCLVHDDSASDAEAYREEFGDPDESECTCEEREPTFDVAETEAELAATAYRDSDAGGWTYRHDRDDCKWTALRQAPQGRPGAVAVAGGEGEAAADGAGPPPARRARVE